MICITHWWKTQYKFSPRPPREASFKISLPSDFAYLRDLLSTNRLERYFGWPAGVWLNLQSHHDQQTAKATMKSALAEIQPCTAL